MNKYVRYASFLSVIFIIGMASNVYAQKDMSDELRQAQKLLAKGQYDDAFTQYSYFAEKKGNPIAQFTMGLFYDLGWGRSIDNVEACQWYEKAGEKGVPAAIYSYADCLRDGVGTAADPVKAIEWYEKSAGLGFHLSKCSLAELYLTGTGGSRDPQKGLALCEQVAQMGIVPAQLKMGQFYINDEFGVRNYERAGYWFRIAAERESSEAFYQLGRMSRDGLGGERNLQVARIWFEKAAAKGYRKAYFPVGKLYYHTPKDPDTGLIPPHELAKSYLWLSAAARQAEIGENARDAKLILEEVVLLMPPRWQSDLDPKVDEHFRLFPTTKE